MKEYNDLKESVIWHYARINNIATNPIDCKYCLISDGEFTRGFIIRPVYPLNENFSTIGRADDETSFKAAKYFVVFQSHDCVSKSGEYIRTSGESFNNVFENLETAQRYIIELLL